MLNTRSDLSAQADDILKLLQKEGITSGQQELLARNFGKVRELTYQLAASKKIAAPGLASCVATTLLQLGLCQELSQRFVLEYCLKYKKQNISIIFTSNPAIGSQNEDHAFVLIGEVNAHDSLFIGKGDSSCAIKPKEINQGLIEFLANNKRSVVVDPLFNCSGNLDDGLNPLLAFCKVHNITHVVGIRSYHETQNFVESLSTVKQNAIAIAAETKLAMSLVGTVNPISQSTAPLFQKVELKSLVKKYELPDSSQASLEKGLRKAATNNKAADLKLFISVVKNINAQDTNPDVKRTALHWAAIKGNDECYQLLIDAGAKQDIRDAAENLAGYYKKSAVKNEK